MIHIAMRVLLFLIPAWVGAYLTPGRRFLAWWSSRFSPSPPEPLPLDPHQRFCVNCVHYRPPPRGYDDATSGKCGAFPRSLAPRAELEYLVSGNRSSVPTEYFHCVIAREYKNMCGKDGNSYVPVDTQT